MSLVPLLYRDWWDDLDVERPSRLMDQHFGIALTRDDLLRSFTDVPRRSFLNRYYRPWSGQISKQDSGSTLNVDQEKFQVILDVQQFAPNEITVKVANNSIVVEGKHEEKQDEHGFISRQFVRRYVLPQQHDAEKIVSNLSSDGVLTITAPKKLPVEASGERVIPISQSGPAKPSTA